MQNYALFKNEIKTGQQGILETIRAMTYETGHTVLRSRSPDEVLHNFFFFTIFFAVLSLCKFGHCNFVSKMSQRPSEIWCTDMG